MDMSTPTAGMFSKPRLWLAVLLLAVIGAPVNAAPAPKSIRVVLDDNYPPYIFRDSGGQVQGILKDLWDLWQLRTGITVDFRPMDWGKARATMESGHADVIDTIFDTEERRKIYDFSQPYATIEVPIFFHQSISGIKDAASIKGFTVGVKDGDACVDYLKAHGIDQLKFYPSYEAEVKAAIRQEIRVLCIDKPPAFYFFSREGVIDEFRYSPPLYVGEFHWAVAKGRLDLKHLVEEGFSRISADERAAIETRWMGAKLPGDVWPAAARYGSYVLLVVALGIIALFIWNTALRRRVAARTAELELANKSSRESEARYRALTELSADWYWEQDEHLRMTSISRPNTGQSDLELSTFVGHTRRDAPGVVWNENELRRLETITEARQSFRKFEIGGIFAGGSQRYLTLSGEPIFDASGAFKGYRGVGSDITDRKRSEDEIQRLAFSDPLTGLPNRRLLMDRLEQAMVSALRHGHQDALLFVDMDDFKTLNDSLGHDMGDQMLQQITQRVLTCVREGDTVARLGGDEFVVLLEDFSGSPEEAAAQAEAVGRKIHGALRQTYQLGNRSYHSTASIGITLFGGAQRESIEEPLKRAELAMYKAKALGRDNLRFFEPGMRDAMNARATLETDLHEAVIQGQFLLYYQAQVDAAAHLTGVEALARWLHPKRGLIAPAEFIPVAEASGLILPLGRWVMKTACRQLAAWAARPEMAHLSISVNVSARQFRLPNFVQEVLAILDATGANPKRLKLELTESLLLDNMKDIIAKMNALKGRGVCFSLDDFGTGYSSLSYLKRLPLDELKIDQGFVEDILTNPNDAAIARMVVALAQSMGLAVIAEGVETQAQCDALAGLGCHAYQGYLFGRPLPIEEFEAFALRA